MKSLKLSFTCLCLLGLTAVSAIALVANAQENSLSINTLERVTNLSANVSNTVEARADRLENIAARLESRLIKEAENGVVIDASFAKLEEARAHIAEAANLLVDIDFRVATAIQSPTPLEGWQALAPVYTESNQALIEARADLTETINLMRSAPTE